MHSTLSLYIVPPALSLLCGLYLVFMALGTRAPEKRLFALVCVWYSLLAPAFLCHHMILDERLILTIERWVHFLYVYLPLVMVAFVHRMLSIRRRDILVLLFGLCALLSWTTQNPLYFTGLHKYGWGYIAKGGPAFQAFAIYGGATMAYCVYLIARRLKTETDPFLRTKYIYVSFSFGLAACLAFLNIPAMHGVDFYPPGNFTFLPMALLAHGIFRYRLVQIRNLVQIATLRAILFLLILVPNIAIFEQWSQHGPRLAPELRFCVALIWFLVNYWLIAQARALLTRVLFKSRRQLRQAETLAIKEMLVLRQTDHLTQKVSQTIRAVLPFAWARIYVWDDGAKKFVDTDGLCRELPEDLLPRLLRFEGIIERHGPKTASGPGRAQEPLTALLALLNAAYAVPLVFKESLVGLLALPHKGNGQPIQADEAAFIMNIAQPLSMALSNAMMFQRISSLKDRLQTRTETLTQEIAERKRAEQSLQEAQAEIRENNLVLEKAILQANEMTAKVEISNHLLTKEMEDRKRIEAALRQSETMYRLIADNSTDVIWTIDLKGRFSYLSPSIRHLLGYTPQEMLALHIQDVLTPASYEVATKAIAEELAALNTPEGALRKSRTTELEQVCKDGTTVWTEVNTRFLKNEQREIGGILGMTRDISERRKSEQELLYMAYHDALTGLYNRKAFIELLDNEIKYAQRYGSGLALLFFDLNRFKQVNDSFGHEIGDQLLKAVAERLKSAVRDSDIVFRLGGDEFTIILKTPEEIFPEVVVRRILENLAEPYRFQEIRVDFVSASIGVSSFPRDGATAAELMKSADTAMYEAKKSNVAFCCFSPEMAQSRRLA